MYPNSQNEMSARILQYITEVNGCQKIKVVRKSGCFSHITEWIWVAENPAAYTIQGSEKKMPENQAVYPIPQKEIGSRKSGWLCHTTERSGFITEKDGVRKSDHPAKWGGRHGPKDRVKRVPKIIPHPDWVGRQKSATEEMVPDGNAMPQIKWVPEYQAINQRKAVP